MTPDFCQKEYLTLALRDAEFPVLLMDSRGECLLTGEAIVQNGARQIPGSKLKEVYNKFQR